MGGAPQYTCALNYLRLQSITRSQCANNQKKQSGRATTHNQCTIKILNTCIRTLICWHSFKWALLGEKWPSLIQQQDLLHRMRETGVLGQKYPTLSHSRPRSAPFPMGLLSAHLVFCCPSVKGPEAQGQLERCNLQGHV